MKNESIRAALLCPATRLGDCGENACRLAEAAVNAAKEGAAIAVFGELALTGATCGNGILLAPADMKTIYDRTLFANAVKLCEDKNIAYQYPTSVSLPGGEGGAIHQNGSGIRTLSVGIPTRNLHSGSEIIKMRDLEAALTFLREWLLPVC